MNRLFSVSARVVVGVLTIAGVALPQRYTVSAKPGAVSYVEGDVSVNGAPVSSKALVGVFLSKNDLLSTDSGKAEVLLSPGVFLRVGENSQVRMISPSLVDLQLELVSGKVMVEVDEVVPGSSTGVIDHGSSTILAKPGLYRFTADNQPAVSVLDGKAAVYFGAKKIDLGKNKEALLTDELPVSKLDLDKTDDLYAWSNVRAQYDAAVSYQGSSSVYNSGYSNLAMYQNSGTYWNGAFNSWMWLPGSGAYYSPFGWGFYGPGLVAFAPLAGYGYGYGNGYAGGVYVAPVSVTGKPLPVPINPKHPGVVLNATSPAVYSNVRQQVVQTIQKTGYEFHTSRGTPAAQLSGGRTYANPQAAYRAAASSASTAAATRSNQSYSGGGTSGGGSASGWAGRSSSSSASSGSSVSHSMSSGGGGSSRSK